MRSSWNRVLSVISTWPCRVGQLGWVHLEVEPLQGSLEHPCLEVADPSVDSLEAVLAMGRRAKVSLY